MAKQKSLEQLRAEKEQVEKRLAQEQHKLERLENRKKYLEKGERQKRTHRLCNLGGTIESLAPEVKNLTRTEMTELMEHIFGLPEIHNRIVCFDIKQLGKQLKKLGMLIVQDAVWGRVTANRDAGKSTRYYIDEFHLLLKEEQTAAYSIEIWKRFRKWGGLPTAITQNVKDLLASPEVSNIFENSDFVYMLNQANGDRQILAKQLNISPHQLSYVTHSGSGEGLLFYGNTILPFVDHFPHDLELYKIMTTKLSEVTEAEKHE